jgi:hypothetical protein
LDRVEVIEADPGRSPGGELRLAGDDPVKSGVELLVLIGAEKEKLILGYSGSFARVYEEAHTIAGSKALEVPDLDVLEVPCSLRRER